MNQYSLRKDTKPWIELPNIMTRQEPESEPENVANKMPPIPYALISDWLKTMESRIAKQRDKKIPSKCSPQLHAAIMARKAAHAQDLDLVRGIKSKLENYADNRKMTRNSQDNETSPSVDATEKPMA